MMELVNTKIVCVVQKQANYYLRGRLNHFFTRLIWTLMRSPVTQNCTLALHPSSLAYKIR